MESVVVSLAVEEEEQQIPLEIKIIG